MLSSMVTQTATAARVKAANGDSRSQTSPDQNVRSDTVSLSAEALDRAHSDPTEAVRAKVIAQPKSTPETTDYSFLKPTGAGTDDRAVSDEPDGRGDQGADDDSGFDGGFDEPDGVPPMGVERAARGLGEVLTDKQVRELKHLRHSDRDVRSQQQAHLRAGGGHVRGPVRYEYRVGPDGHRYAVGGHVNVDTSSVEGNPAATLQKARLVQRAALASDQPTAQERRVASKARAMARRATAELRLQQEVVLPEMPRLGRSETPVDVRAGEPVRPETNVLSPDPVEPKPRAVSIPPEADTSGIEQI